MKSGYPWDTVIFGDVSFLNEIYLEVPDEGLRSFNFKSNLTWLSVYIFKNLKEKKPYWNEKILGVGLD